MSHPPPGKPGRKPDTSWVEKAGIGVMIPTMLGATMLVASVMGYYLDLWLGTKPWLFLLFLIFGFVAAVREVIRMVKRLDDDK